MTTEIVIERTVTTGAARNTDRYIYWDGAQKDILDEALDRAIEWGRRNKQVEALMNRVHAIESSNRAVLHDLELLQMELHDA